MDAALPLTRWALAVMRQLMLDSKADLGHSALAAAFEPPSCAMPEDGL